jgi:hypothetical protein
LTVPGADRPITAANIEEQLIRYWDQPAALAGATDQAVAEQWWLHRKDFVAVIARAILERLQQGNLDVVNLAATVEQSLAARALQLWLADPTAQAALHGLGWDGALRPEPGADFLAVVDTNMGYNKVDAAIQRTVDYAVAWPEGADASAEVALTLTYTHTAPPGTDPECKPEPRYGETYAAMIGRCYFSYLRVYAPAGSELIRATGVPTDSVNTMPGERGTTKFTGYVVVEPGATRQVQLRYRLPPALTPADYRLVVQRQAGTEPLPLHLTVGDRDQRVLIDQDRWRYP